MRREARDGYRGSRHAHEGGDPLRDGLLLSLLLQPEQRTHCKPKGSETKEAHETGQLQDLKPQSIKQKLQIISKLMAKTFQNESQSL